MSKQIAKLLKADLNSASNLALIAKMLEKKGRANDTILAHISSKEAKLLKELGGSGTVNPETGLLEFFDEAGFEGITSEQVAQPAPSFDTGGFEGMTQSQYDAAQPAEVSSGGGLRATPAAFTETIPSAQPLRFGAVEGIQAQTPTSFGPSVPAAPSLGYGVTDKYTPTAAQEVSPAPQGKSISERLGLDKLSTQDMIRLGLAGGLGAVGYTKSKQAAKQAEQAAGEQKALAQPYQTQGQELIRAAQAGELSPTGQQALQAQRAQLAQGVEARGGVGAQQAAAQAEAFRQQLLQQQYNYGLQIAQVGDSIALGAIKTGLQADQQVNQATQNFYTNLAAVAGGIPMVRS